MSTSASTHNSANEDDGGPDPEPKLIELAVAGGADSDVTNNMRDVKGGDIDFPKTRILTPKQFNQTTFNP